MDIKVPNLGDIEEVEVIEICVEVGETVGENDTLVVIESDKASMDVPAGVEGVITEISVSLGDMVGEGALLAKLDGAEGADASTEQENIAQERVAQENVQVAEEPASQPAEQPQVEQASQGTSQPEAVAAVSTAPQVLDILVPDIGDANGVVVIEVAVSAGEQVEEGDLIVVLESDKASMEITAEHTGELTEVAVNVDDEVAEGTLLAKIRTQVVAVPEPIADTPASPTHDAAPPAPEQENPEPTAPVSAPAPIKAEDGKKAKVYAGPATRRLARELGVDLSLVPGTGQRGRIVKDDVKAFVKAQMTSESGGGGQLAWPTVPEVDFSRFGEVEQVELSRIRQRGADNLHRSWVNLPHVTQHDEADITDLETFRAELKGEAEAKGVRLTPLAFIVKACAKALSENPEFNSSLAADGKHLILKRFINIGMAVDTPEGLVVPVIRSADEKDIWQISNDIAELSQKARDKKLAMDDLSGGTFSVSSLGRIGGTGFTPIVNAPEVAILGVANLQTKPLWTGSEFVPRKVLPLSLSYDHRVINGADGGRFMVRLKELLEDLRRMAL